MKARYMKFLSVACLVLMAGCCSYSELCDKGDVVSYEVVNPRYKLLWCVPIMSGTTWKEGPYGNHVGGLTFFSDKCSLDDNLASVRHACDVVGSKKVRNLTARVDDWSVWSFFLVQKRIIKTSCEIVK